MSTILPCHSPSVPNYLSRMMNYVFFVCCLARYVWSLVAMVIGADCRPSNLNQFCELCVRGLYLEIKSSYGWPSSYLMGIVASPQYGVLWKEKIQISYWDHLLSQSASSYLNHWAGLRKDETKSNLEMGTEALKEVSLLHHPQTRHADQEDPGAGTVLLC